MKLQAVLDTFWPLAKKYRVPILTYHSIHREPIPECLDMTPKCFAKQMNFLARWGYLVIDLEKKLGCQKCRGVTLTFDDGYENVYTVVFPILKQFGFPATVFVVTDWIGKKEFLSLDQIKEMEQAGISFGSHGCSHRYLPELSLPEAEKEICESKQILEEKLGHPIGLFSYPYGGFSHEIVELVKRAGYLAAFTTNRGLPGRAPDRYTLRRIRMGPNSQPIHLWAKCSGYYDLFRRPRPCN